MYRRSGIVRQLLELTQSAHGCGTTMGG
jgi:hypothetical protein